MRSVRRPNRRSLERLVASVAKDIEPLLDECVFVGGISTGLLVTDPVAVQYPVTDDVDVVAE